MAIKVNNTTVIDDSRNIGNIGIATVGTAVTISATGIDVTGIVTSSTVRVGSTVTVNATGVNVTGIVTSSTAIVGSAVTVNATGVNVTGVVTTSGGIQGVGIYSGGNLVTTGIITALNFVGTGNTFAVVGNRVDISIAGGSGGSSGVSDGVVFNTGITSVTSARLVGIGSTVLSIPSTAGKEYIIYSINASNIAAGNTDVNVIGAFDFIGSGTTERSYFAYNIPIPTGTSVELLRQPQILNPSDKILMRGTDYDRVGSDSVVEVYISYQEKTSSSYFGVGFGTVGIASTTPVSVYTSTGAGSVIQSIRLVNRTDVGGYPVSVTVTSGVNTTYLIDDLIVPKYASVEILDTPKTIKTNDVISVIVDQVETIDVQVSGIKVA